MTLRYAVGIDLGTSNSALAFADLAEPDPHIHVFGIPQLVDRSLTQPRNLLPSHLYLPSPHEGLGEVLVGTFARDRGAEVPGRHVASAKSWLCHPSVDRTAEILPWGAPPDVPRLSPVAASARILRHLRETWDGAHPDAPLGGQDLVVTVPASFDEGARALTLRAAEEAGLHKVVLLEEPQAAFYDWTRVHRGDLEAELSGVHLVLVVDVGGGTTDLTLIRTQVREDEPPVLERIAVGDHLLLGGDNMDLALARVAEQRLGQRLNAAQFGALVQAARAAKELLLAHGAPERTTLAVAGAGSRLIGGTLSTELARDEVRALLVDGFFPRAAADDEPARSARTAGLAELGLPYAADPAITRHTAAFLKRHARTAGELRVDAVLYNGGALTPHLLAERLTEVISSWVGTSVRRLRNDAPDLAVARGAAAYALVRRGLGLRIGGGSPRTYYVGVGDGGQAVCVVPRGAAEGVEQSLDRDFSLVLGRPVRFRLFASAGFRPERAGDLAQVDDDLTELPPLQTVIPGEGAAPVRLKAALTEIGTLEVFCEGAQRWKLEFQLRAEAREAGAVSQLPRNIDAAREQLQIVFGKKPVHGASAKDMWRNLERVLGDRSSWTLATDRDLWGVLWAGAQKRRRSPDHERMFLALCGFLLRPGFGAPLDSWRVEQTWTLFAQGLTHHKEAAVWAAWWILWRRIAAGLSSDAHLALFEAIAPHLRPTPKQRVANPGKRPPGMAMDEMVRLVGALEQLPVDRKIEAGGWLLEKLSSPGRPAPGVAWALGRIGARIPVAGAAHHTVPPEIATEWLQRLLELDFRAVEDAPFAVAQIARRAGDRARDLDDLARERAAARLERASVPPEWARGIREVRALGETDEQRVFGEALPLGLHLAA
ncbi:MAG TPA: Hsp70 family protein [Myxococcales bacterium]|nr:Hsp70 family protein [Myxococcales bacterium]